MYFLAITLFLVQASGSYAWASEECNQALEPYFYTMPKTATFANQMPYLLMESTAKRSPEIEKHFWGTYGVRPSRTPLNIVRIARHLFSTLFDPGPEGKRPIKSVPDLEQLLYVRQHLSSFGKQFATAIEGRQMLDLGCGLPDFSVGVRAIAELFGATDYVGVDSHHSLRSSKQNRSIGFQPRFQVTFVQSDLLKYLDIFERIGPLFVFIEGLEFDPRTQKDPTPTVDYLTRTMERLKNILKPGDVLFIGALVSFLHPLQDVRQHCINAQKWCKAGDERLFQIQIDPNAFGFSRFASEAIMSPNGTENGQFDLWVKQ